MMSLELCIPSGLDSLSPPNHHPNVDTAEPTTEATQEAPEPMEATQEATAANRCQGGYDGTGDPGGDGSESSSEALPSARANFMSRTAGLLEPCDLDTDRLKYLNMSFSFSASSLAQSSCVFLYLAPER